MTALSSHVLILVSHEMPFLYVLDSRELMSVCVCMTVVSKHRCSHAYPTVSEEQSVEESH